MSILISILCALETLRLFAYHPRTFAKRVGFNSNKLERVTNANQIWKFLTAKYKTGTNPEIRAC
jgi:hypothetical protein